MRVRYCETQLQKLMPCGVGWGNSSCEKNGKINARTCHDEPMKENCHNIVDDNALRCPYCGGDLVLPISLELEYRK